MCLYVFLAIFKQKHRTTLKKILFRQDITFVSLINVRHHAFASVKLVGDMNIVHSMIRELAVFEREPEVGFKFLAPILILQ